VSIFVLKDKLEQALQLVEDMVRRPSFPQPEFELFKKEAEVGLLRQKADSDSLAGRRFSKAVFGDHPYGRALPEEPVKAIPRGECERSYPAGRPPRLRACDDTARPPRHQARPSRLLRGRGREPCIGTRYRTQADRQECARGR